MIAYEIYWLDPIKGQQPIGILPERRKKSERVSQESIMNWAKIYLGFLVDFKNLIFVQVTIGEDTEDKGNVSFHHPSMKRKVEIFK